MNVFTSSELASKTKAVCDTALREGSAYITSNGKVNLALIDITLFDTLEEAISSLVEWRALCALRRIWAETDKRPPITMEEIDAEIRAARLESLQATGA